MKCNSLSQSKSVKVEIENGYLCCTITDCLIILLLFFFFNPLLCNYCLTRSGWASKKSQERILAVCITRAGFEEILSKAYTAKVIWLGLSLCTEWQTIVTFLKKNSLYIFGLLIVLGLNP